MLLTLKFAGNIYTQGAEAVHMPVAAHEQGNQSSCLFVPWYVVSHHPSLNFPKLNNKNTKTVVLVDDYDEFHQSKVIGF